MTVQVNKLAGLGGGRKGDVVKGRDNREIPELNAGPLIL